MPEATDRVFFRGIVLFAHHGVHPEEETLGQRFEVDLDCWIDATACSLTDNTAKAVRYDHVYETVRAIVVDGERVQLIETLAERIAAGLLADYPAVARVRVEIRKPGAPVPAVFDAVGVEITRRRA